LSRNVKPGKKDVKVLGLNPAPIAMMAMLGLAGLSQFKLQAFESQTTMDLADKVNKYFVNKIDTARRGAIYTADMKPLAEEAKTWTLTINFAKIPRTSSFAAALSEASGIPSHEFSDKESGTRTWSQPLTSAQKEAIQAVKKSYLADGVSIDASEGRTYPMGIYASAIVGLQRIMPGTKDGVIRTGFESSLNKQLVGVNGRQRGLQDKNGEFLPLRSYEPDQIRRDGAKIVTTIDSELQIASTIAVRRAVEANRADDGVAIVVQPQTGEVLTVATWPAADPNVTGNSMLDGKNPAYMNVLEPGSTFKILTLAKAINDGVVAPGQYTHCTGTMAIGTKSKIRCDEHHGNRAHGDIGPEMAIAKSCNVSAAFWSRKVGVDGFFEYLDELGLRETTGLNLQGEVRSRAVRDRWAAQLQLATLGFGQSMSVTPLALAGAFSTIANDGKRVPLKLVKDVNGKPVTPDKEAVQVLSKKACDYTLDCMEAVIESDRGTGKTLRIPGYRLGGKTGTAQKIGKGGADGYVSNFVGVIPAKEPKALVLIMINNPKAGKFYGADVAGPVFTEVAKMTIKRLSIPPTQ
jgi:cell division protein FtsI/penicillin-binding protein 2